MYFAVRPEEDLPRNENGDPEAAAVDTGYSD